MARASVSFHVYGTPAPQGSKKHVGGGRMVEVAKGLKGWRKAVHDAAVEASKDLCWLDGPLRLRTVFYLRRPNSHYVGNRRTNPLRESAPRFHTIPPDGDKLARGVGDALTGVLYQDDGQIACNVAWKLYADEPGAFITITELEGDK